MNNRKEDIVPIILVNYNNTEDTVECIKSINESVGVKPFIIIVDNASKDRKKVEELKEISSNIHLMLNEENVGFGRANNVGIIWAQTNIKFDYLFILNNDTVVEKDTIRFLVGAINSNSNYGIVTPKIVFYEKPHICWYCGGKIDWKFGRGVALGLFKSADSQYVSFAKNVEFASGCAMLIRRVVFEKIGGFDPRYFMYHEDVEFSLRVNENGFIIRYIPNAIIHHKGQGSMRKNSDPFISAWSPHNTNLAFYIENGIHNILLNMNVHAHGLKKILFFFFFPLLISKKIITFLYFRKMDAIFSIYKAIKRYNKTRKEKFVNELI